MMGKEKEEHTFKMIICYWKFYPKLELSPMF